MADVHEQCLDELVAITKGLKLSVPADQIRKRRLEHKVESNGQTTIHTWEPGITFFPMQEVEAPGTHGREDIGYGCGCIIVLAADHGPSANIGRAIEFRAKIRRKVISQKLTTVQISGGYYLTTKVSHLPINQPRGPHSYEASSLLIRCWVRESRG